MDHSRSQLLAAAVLEGNDRRPANRSPKGTRRVGFTPCRKSTPQGHNHDESRRGGTTDAASCRESRAGLCVFLTARAYREGDGWRRTVRVFAPGKRAVGACGEGR